MTYDTIINLLKLLLGADKGNAAGEKIYKFQHHVIQLVLYNHLIQGIKLSV